MSKSFQRDVIHRYDNNPLITIEYIHFPCNTVFNTVCAKHKSDDLKIYYGASDTSICAGTANVNSLMQFCTLEDHEC